MVLTFWNTDGSFEKNTHYLRQAKISSKPYAPNSLNILIDGAVVVEASTAHIRADGWFAYSDDTGEYRIKPDRVAWVTAYFVPIL